MRHDRTDSSLAPWLLAVLLSAAMLAPPGVAAAGIVPPLDLKSLSTGADLVTAGRVSSVREDGPAVIQTRAGDFPGRRMIATLDIERVLKGPAVGPSLDFSFLLPDEMIGYVPIGSGQFAVFFLTHSGDGFAILSAYHPYVVAVPGTAVPHAGVFERVVHEIGAVLDSPTATDELKREAIYTLRETPGPEATAELLKGPRLTDPVARLASMECLLLRNNIQYLPEAADLLMHAPTDLEPGTLSYLAPGIAMGVRALGAVPALSKLLRAPSPEARRAAAEALAGIGGSTTLAPLAQGLNDADGEVRYWAVVGLARLTGQDPWYPSLGEYRTNEEKYVKHWREWTQSNGLTSSPHN